MGKRIKSEKKGGGGEESKFIEEYTPLQPDRVEGFLRAPLAATLYDSCLITEYSYGRRINLKL